MKMKLFFLGAFSGVVFFIAAGFIWLMAGGMPVSTSGDPLPLEKKIAHIALKAAMRGQTNQSSPIPFDETNLVRGAKIYQVNCAVCHGLPFEALSPIAQGLFPPPPKLMPPSKGVTDDKIGSTYWKVKNGMRLTGMPGFQKTLSETEMWQVSALLLNAHQLSEPVKAELAKSIYK